MGYLNRESETKEVMAADEGWLNLGHLGYRDPDDYLVVHGRRENFVTLRSGESWQDDGKKCNTLSLLIKASHNVEFSLRRNRGAAKVGAADPSGAAVRAARRDRGRRRGLRVRPPHRADDGRGRRGLHRAVPEADGGGRQVVQGMIERFTLNAKALTENDSSECPVR